MADRLTPRDEADVVDAVGAALAHGRTLEVAGHGTRRGIGRPLQTDATLDLSALTGITLYEPAELVLSAKAGTPLAAIEAELAAHGQMLGFEPPDLGPLFGLSPGRGTLGGALGANAAGPRRAGAGAMRDHVLGVRAVTGRGELFKAGGRVVKNVTGFDLSKLVCGAWGTLAVATEITVKVLPAPERVETVLLFGADEFAAGRAITAAMASAAVPSAAAYLPARLLVHFSDRAVSAAGRPIAALRLEGVPASVTARRHLAERLLAAFGDLELLPDAASRVLWRELRDVKPFQEETARALWAIATPPAGGADVLARLAVIPGAGVFVDHAGALVWAAMPGIDTHAWEVRAAAAAVGGLAVLVRATAAERSKVPPFPPQAPALAALTRRIKAGFDPNGVLGPGRMWAGV